MTTPQMIAVSKLALSPRNVRSSSGDQGFASLKADIAARGVLQNLIGFAVAKPRGRLEITAGGRRLRAVQELIAEGVLPKDHEVPVLVLNDPATAAETSLAENFQRLAMNPADECNAFLHCIDAGAVAADVAIRFGLSERFVEGRLRLARLAETVFQALREGAITLDVAQAFATTSDQIKQAEVFERLRSNFQGYRADTVRRLMEETSTTGADRRARLVGRDAYVEAGGRIEQDLFADAETERWLDLDILERLADARLHEAAAALAAEAGVATVEVTADARPSWERIQELRPLQLQPRELTIEEAAKLNALYDEMEIFEQASDNGLNDDQAARAEAIEAEIAAIEERPAELSEEDRARAVAFVVLGADGTASLHPTLYTAREASPERTQASDRSAAAPLRAVLSDSLRDELAAQRTEVLRLHLASDPATAIDLAAFLLADRELHSGTQPRGSTLSGAAPQAVRAGWAPDGAATDALGRLREQLEHRWAEHACLSARFDAFRTLSDDARAAWAGWSVARTLEPSLGDGRGSGAFHSHLGQVLGIDTAGWWRPTAANFFGRVRKDVILDALGDVGGAELRARYAAAKKGELAGAAERIFAGQAVVEADTRAAAAAWVPDAMRFAVPAEIAETSLDGDEGELAEGDEEPDHEGEGRSLARCKTSPGDTDPTRYLPPAPECAEAPELEEAA